VACSPRIAIPLEGLDLVDQSQDDLYRIAVQAEVVGQPSDPAEPGDPDVVEQRPLGLGIERLDQPDPDVPADPADREIGAFGGGLQSKARRS
jgi:hypothetical protein